MEVTGFVMDHPAGHGDGMLKDFIGDAELSERVDPAGREREIDRAAADQVPFAWIAATLVEFDVVAAASEISGEHAAGEAATDQDKFCFCRHSIGPRMTQMSRIWQ